jgi:hypothetical protein
MISRQSIDSDAVVIENYITHVMNLAFKYNKLIMWTYNKRKKYNYLYMHLFLRIFSNLCN